MIDDHRHRGSGQRRCELVHQSTFEMQLEMPADLGQALAESDDGVDRRRRAQVTHEVEADATEACRIQPAQLRIRNRHRNERNPDVRASSRRERVLGRGIVEPVRGRLHDDATLDPE